MKSNFNFDRVSPGWHYDKSRFPRDELSLVSALTDTESLKPIVEAILKDPYKEGGVKRIHIGNTVENVSNTVIDNRIAYMKKIGYSENEYFIEFVNDKFPDLEKLMIEQFNLSYCHSCVIILPPGQNMPVHDDTYSYLNKYMKRDYPDVKYDPITNIKRYMVMLTDWDWGQSYGAGNVIKWQWYIGDIFVWKHKLIHWASNASLSPLVFYELTGLEL